MCISTAGSLTLITSTLTSVVQSTVTIPAPTMASPTAPASAPASTPSAPAATACSKPNVNGQYGCPEQCPLDLSKGPFEFPHLLQINGQNGYFGEVNATAKTDFTFDIPASLAGKTCNAYFAIPNKSMLVTSDFSLTSAPGGEVHFSCAGKPAASFAPAAGMSELVYSAPCPAGQAVTFEMTADNGVDFRWFQDYNACAIGLYVVPS
jgi:hypothetical protein